MTSQPLGPALIAGAGVAGLTLALALARRGAQSQIVERAALLEETGAGVQLSPNASRALDALGLGPALDAVSTRPEGVTIRDAPSGRALTFLPLGTGAERRWGAPYRVVHRADLQAALLAAVAKEPLVALTLAAEIQDVRESDGGVALDAAGAHGPATFEGGWLAGADGLRSVVRKALKLPTSVRETGLRAWRAVLPANGLPGFERDRVGMWLGPGAHMIVYPLRRGRDANLVVIGDQRLSGADEMVARWSAVARALVASAAGRWTPWPLHDRSPDARMRRGRVALLGDAAHAALPTLAQGAAFAIEDAVTLARLVADDGPDPLGAYEAARLMRVARLQSEARRQARIDHLGGLAAQARNAALTLAPSSLLLGGLDWIYGWTDA